MSMYVVSHKNADLILPEDYLIIAVGNDKDKVLNKTFSDNTGDNIARIIADIYPNYSESFLSCYEWK